MHACGTLKGVVFKMLMDLVAWKGLECNKKKLWRNSFLTYHSHIPLDFPPVGTSLDEQPSSMVIFMESWFNMLTANNGYGADSAFVGACDFDIILAVSPVCSFMMETRICSD